MTYSGGEVTSVGSDYAAFYLNYSLRLSTSIRLRLKCISFTSICKRMEHASYQLTLLVI